MNNTTQTEQPSFANRPMTNGNNALLSMFNNIDEPREQKQEQLIQRHNMNLHTEI